MNWNLLPIAATKLIQESLADRKLYRATIDGDPGPLTRAAYSAAVASEPGLSIKGHHPGVSKDPSVYPGPRSSTHYPLDSPQAKLAAMWESMVIRSSWEAQIGKAAIRIRQFRGRYERVSAATGVPWEVIGALHMMESSGSFTKHLHNGDPLSARTVRVPAGRPKAGVPPFTWEESAVDALRTLKKLHLVTDWCIGNTLDVVERYNGLGYRQYHPDVPSPYLWSGTTHYAKGKYVSDGKWDSQAVSKQVGAAPLLKVLGYGPPSMT